LPVTSSLATSAGSTDSNRITIEGHTNIAFRDDIASRFLSYGWNVERVGDANGLDRVDRALNSFRKTTDRPALIIADSHIGYGSPHKAGTTVVHGEPLGEEEVKLTKRSYGCPTVGTGTCPFFPRTPRAWAGASLQARC
jgi:transketolase